MNPDIISETIDRTTAPIVHNMGPLTLPDDEIVTLQNGISLHLLSGGDAEVSRIKILLPGGIAESPVPQLYQMANSLLLEGTHTHPSDELADILEYNGAWSGVDTSTHHSSLSLYCTNDTYHTLLPLVREMVTSPAFEGETVANALRAEAARLDVENHKVAYRAACAIRTLVYGHDHPLSTVPCPEQLLDITPSALRDSHEKRLDPKGIHIYLSGRLSDSMISDTERMFSTIPAREEFTLPRLQFPVHTEGGRVHVEMPDSLQSGVRLIIPAIGRIHPDYVPLRMAVIALGGYFGSRLMLNIREEKGLTYGITASPLGYKHSGFISVSSQTDPSTVDMLIEETVKEIERMKNPASYTPDEVTRLSRFMLSELAGVLDTPFSRMDFLQTRITANTPAGYFAIQEQTARNLSPERLAEMAEKYFNTECLFIATAGKSQVC